MTHGTSTIIAAAVCVTVLGMLVRAGAQCMGVTGCHAYFAHVRACFRHQLSHTLDFMGEYTNRGYKMELEVFTRFYSDVQKSILNPLGVASLLRQEGIASEDLLDEVSAKATLSVKTASIMRHVRAAVRTNAKSFWKFVAVLEQSPLSYAVAHKMKEAMKLQEKGDNLYTVLAVMGLSVLIIFQVHSTFDMTEAMHVV